MILTKVHSSPNPDNEEEKARREGRDGVGVWAHHLDELALAAVVATATFVKTLP